MTIVPAPPPGFILFPLRVASTLIPGANWWGNGNGSLQMQYGNTNNIPNPMDTNSGDGGYASNFEEIQGWDYWKGFGANIITPGAGQPLTIGGNNFAAGALNAATILANGAFYSVGDVLGVGANPDGHVATVSVASVNGTGGILTFNITSGGIPPADGYVTGGVQSLSSDVFPAVDSNTILSATVVFTLTSVANASGGNTVYTGTITGGTPVASGAANAYVGVAFTISGFTNGVANNGLFWCTASTATTLTLNNTAGVAETHAATAAATTSAGDGNATVTETGVTPGDSSITVFLEYAYIPTT